MVRTPEQFARDMQIAADQGDQEYSHVIMDGLMVDMLLQLGYGEGAKIFKETGKWYA